MNNDVKSFQENIRRTFILFSLTPVIITSLAAILLFVFTWSTYMSTTNRNDCNEIAEEIDLALDDYYSMMGDLKYVINKNGGSCEGISDEIFSIQYRRTQRFDDTGSLTILSPEGRILFSSRDSVPEYLTRPEYLNWGVWKKIKMTPDVVCTVLYNSNLYVAQAVYQGKELQYAMVCGVPYKNL